MVKDIANFVNIIFISRDGRSMKDWRVVIAAIASITILEAIAIFNGINGILLTTVIAILAGLGGYSLPLALKGGERK